MRIPPTRGKRLQGATVARHRGCCWSTSKSTRIPSCRWARLTEVPGTSYCLVDYAARTGGASGLLPPHLASFGPFRFARRHTNRRNMSHRQDSRFTIRLRIPIASTPLLAGDGARAVAPVVDVRSGSGTNRETFEASNSLRCLLSLNGQRQSAVSVSRTNVTQSRHSRAASFVRAAGAFFSRVSRRRFVSAVTNE